MKSLIDELREFLLKVENVGFKDLIKFTGDYSIDTLNEALELALEIKVVMAIGVARKGKHTKEKEGYLNAVYLRRIDTKYGTVEFKKPRVLFKDKAKKFESRIIGKYKSRAEEIVHKILVTYFTGQGYRKMTVLLQKLYGTIVGSK